MRGAVSEGLLSRAQDEQAWERHGSRVACSGRATSLCTSTRHRLAEQAVFPSWNRKQGPEGAPTPLPCADPETNAAAQAATEDSVHVTEHGCLGKEPAVVSTVSAHPRPWGLLHSPLQKAQERSCVELSRALEPFRGGALGR